MTHMNDDAPSRAEAERDAAIDQANTRMWWSDHHNLHLVAEHLGEFGPLLEVLDKPWHWTEEFIAACEVEAGEHDEPVGNTIARRLGATKLTITIIEVPDEEPVGDEDMYRGDR